MKRNPKCPPRKKMTILGTLLMSLVSSIFPAPLLTHYSAHLRTWVIVLCWPDWGIGYSDGGVKCMNCSRTNYRNERSRPSVSRPFMCCWQLYVERVYSSDRGQYRSELTILSLTLDAIDFTEKMLFIVGLSHVIRTSTARVQVSF